MADGFPYLTHVPSDAAGRATIRVDRGRASGETVSPWLFAKFCEHLGANIYHGMEAQILLNGTFSRWRLSSGDGHPDGGVQEDGDRESIRRKIEQAYTQRGWPDPAAAAQAHFQGAAYGWAPVGEVRLSPDVGPHGDRAQRIEAQADEAGLAQWLWLPLHRTHSFGFRLVARAVAPVTMTIALGDSAGGPETTTTADLTTEWQTLTGELDLPGDAVPDATYRLALRLPAGANVVIDRLLLYPDDHLGGADPDIVRFLREAKLPLLRWPGGNFVSGYHWRDGVGPIDARPVLPNPAWGGTEFNTFGTAEFIGFCRLVGCEPLICVNAGNGTPQEAADWIEYCNGGPDTAMGKLRVEHGHPEPFNVRLWEIGNELWGRWQVGWTTAAGNADRYREFRRAMLQADPSIYLLGCGQGNAPLSDWNRTLIERAGPELRCITDHILTGGSVTTETDGEELAQAFFGQATVLEDQYAKLREQMLAAGCDDPKLAITELQLFAQFRGEVREGGLSRATMPRQDSVAEALYFMTIAHAAIRLGGFVNMITHSATVNHAGGLRKSRERVWANPVHYAHQMGIALAGGEPLAVTTTCASYGTEHRYGSIPPLQNVPLVDAVAVRQTDGTLVVSVVNRSLEPVAATLEGVGTQATAMVLAGERFSDSNTIEAPERVVPRALEVVSQAGAIRLGLPAAAMVVVRVSAGG